MVAFNKQHGLWLSIKPILVFLCNARHCIFTTLLAFPTVTISPLMSFFCKPLQFVCHYLLYVSWPFKHCQTCCWTNVHASQNTVSAQIFFPNQQTALCLTSQRFTNIAKSSEVSGQILRLTLLKSWRNCDRGLCISCFHTEWLFRKVRRCGCGRSTSV